MKPFVILNPSAGSAGNLGALLEKLKRLKPIEILKTTVPGEAESFARAAVRQRHNYLIAAGGDGTLNEVVNGCASRAKEIRIGILPLGTGNDFARTLGLPRSLDNNIDILRGSKTKPFDIVQVKGPRARYFVNVSAGGFSGMVDREITAKIKRTWGPLAYIRGAAAALPKLHAYKTRVVLDEREEFSTQLYNVIIANGRFVAGGLAVAPDADPADGLLEVVLIPKRGTAKLALIAAEIVMGKQLSCGATIFRKAKKISVSSRPRMWFNVDGELVGTAPAVFKIIPRALRFVLG
jgi:diacylglycerol kinase (ATP)